MTAAYIALAALAIGFEIAWQIQGRRVRSLADRLIALQELRLAEHHENLRFLEALSKWEAR